MRPSGYSPAEFARLLSLPESDPERIRAEGTAEFSALKAMLSDFTGERRPAESAGELGSMRHELERRLHEALEARREPASGMAGHGGQGRRLPRESARGLFDWLRAPAGRWAFTFALVAVAAGIGWWVRPGFRGDRLRSVEVPSGFELRTVREAGDGFELEWPPLPGAESYRVVFLDATLLPIARFEAGAATRLTVPRDSLPAALPPDARMSVEVEAWRARSVIGTTPARAIRLR